MINKSLVIIYTNMDTQNYMVCTVYNPPSTLYPANGNLPYNTDHPKCQTCVPQYSQAPYKSPYSACTRNVYSANQRAQVEIDLLAKRVNTEKIALQERGCITSDHIVNYALAAHQSAMNAYQQKQLNTRALVANCKATYQ
jgi:hypothetical protein